jgi:hypothetical protein
MTTVVPVVPKSVKKPGFIARLVDASNGGSPGIPGKAKKTEQPKAHGKDLQQRREEYRDGIEPPTTTPIGRNKDGPQRDLWSIDIANMSENTIEGDVWKPLEKKYTYRKEVTQAWDPKIPAIDAIREPSDILKHNNILYQSQHPWDKTFLQDASLETDPMTKQLKAVSRHKWHPRERTGDPSKCIQKVYSPFPCAIRTPGDIRRVTATLVISGITHKQFIAACRSKNKTMPVQRADETALAEYGSELHHDGQPRFVLNISNEAIAKIMKERAPLLQSSKTKTETNPHHYILHQIVLEEEYNNFPIAMDKYVTSWNHRGATSSTPTENTLVWAQPEGLSNVTTYDGATYSPILPRTAVRTPKVLFQAINLNEPDFCHWIGFNFEKHFEGLKNDSEHASYIYKKHTRSTFSETQIKHLYIIPVENEYKIANVGNNEDPKADVFASWFVMDEFIQLRALVDPCTLNDTEGMLCKQMGAIFGDKVDQLHIPINISEIAENPKYIMYVYKTAYDALLQEKRDKFRVENTVISTLGAPGFSTKNRIAAGCNGINLELFPVDGENGLQVYEHLVDNDLPKPAHYVEYHARVTFIIEDFETDVRQRGVPSTVTGKNRNQVLMDSMFAEVTGSYPQCDPYPTTSRLQYQSHLEPSMPRAT